MDFRKYQHIERFGSSEVEGIEAGTVYVFPKIDGTNSSVYLRDGKVRAASRNRELTPERDNAGFYAYAVKDDKIRAYLEAHPDHRLFGEWLVPHSLKTYRDDAWRKFYIFDVCVDSNENQTGLRYLPYEEYQPEVDQFGLSYIEPLRIMKNGKYENFVRILDENDFLIKDGCGVGEGIVLKNYAFFNRYGRQTWAKIVTSEFKERHRKFMGAPVVIGDEMIEEKIADEFVTAAFVEKEVAKIENENGAWRSKLIPQLLGRVWHEFICEEMWNICKKFKNPKIDFRILNKLVIQRVKSIKPDLFA